MRKTFKRFVATMLAAAIVGAPASAWAGDYCPTGKLVESHATGGDYIAGLLIYETMGTVSRQSSIETTTTTVTTSMQVGVPGTGATTTVTETQTVMAETSTNQTPEPLGFYAMNDGSMYEINCVTGENQRSASMRRDRKSVV